MPCAGWWQIATDTGSPRPWNWGARLSILKKHLYRTLPVLIAPSHRRVAARLLLITAPLLIGACGSSQPAATSTPPGTSLAERDAATLEARFPGIRTVPDPTCVDEYLGTTGLLIPSLLDPEQYSAVKGGPAATPAVAAALPSAIHLRGRQQTYTAEHHFAALDGRIYVRANRETTAIDEPWRELPLPRCLDGQVSEISADGTVLLALNARRDIYTLDYANGAVGAGGWTRRWGPYFWTDLGGWIPDDVRDWATSHLTPSDDAYFVDGGGHQQTPAGILTAYLLRGDGLRITYLDPWLPMDESREVCGPERGTAVMAGLSGSGSTVMVVTATGEIYTRLYEFDVSGANAVFLDYSWQDQSDSESPLVQLPAPGWVHHPRVPGPITDRVSLRKLPPGTEHRQMRVEGTDAAGNSGYWQKDQAQTHSSDWKFVLTGEALQGRPLPLAPPHFGAPEDFRYTGSIDGYAAALDGFNPYCSPAKLRIAIGDSSLELEVHSTDGLRQERRARGLDAYPRYYRSAVKVPLALWQARAQQPAAVQDFLARHFGERRVLDGPLYATLGEVRIAQACWTLSREAGGALALETQPPLPDMGTVVAEVLAQQEENREPTICPP